tara:strand:- start:2 stop:454 length:453 start_codon:yes stop_codon:yes gene_type:complete
MIHYKKFLLVGLLSILLPLSKGSAEKRSGIGLEILGKPISAVKNNYSCAPTMISGPSKRKIICVNSSEKLIIAALKSRIVSVEVIQFTTNTSIKNILNSHLESCQKSKESNFKLKFNCEEQRTINLELDVSASELRTEFCFSQHCRITFN